MCIIVIKLLYLSRLCNLRYTACFGIHIVCLNTTFSIFFNVYTYFSLVMEIKVMEIDLPLILAEVSRLFVGYNGGRTTTRRRTAAAPAQVHSYTHCFCSIEDKNASLVPNRYTKDRLAAAGLGEKRLTFQGMSV